MGGVGSVGIAVPTNVSLLHRVIEAKLVDGIVGSDKRRIDVTLRRSGRDGMDEGRPLAHSPMVELKEGFSGLVGRGRQRKRGRSRGVEKEAGWDSRD